MPDIRHGRNHAYYNSDLVVALEHVDAVRTTLEQAGVRVETGPHNKDLGLALLMIADEQAAAAAIEEALAAVRESGTADSDSGDESSRAAASRELTAMDRLLQGLREIFAARHAGWSPTMGKNRLLGHVVGGGEISHGGGPPPRAVTRTLSRRPATPGEGVRVGVLDTSISAHPHLAGGWVSAANDVLPGGVTQNAVAGHATFVAGLILNQAPGCVVDHRTVLSDENGESTSWEVAEAIVEMAGRGLDVLNLSLVCYTEDGQPPLVLAAAIERLDPRTVVVAAAGNHGDLDKRGGNATAATLDGHPRQPAWPAALDHVVAVGATDSAGEPAEFTPANVPWIDMTTLGVDVISTFLDGKVNLGSPHEPPVQDFAGNASWSGTSFAAALVSGAIAARTRPGRRSSRAALKKIKKECTLRDGQPPHLPLDPPK